MKKFSFSIFFFGLLTLAGNINAQIDAQRITVTIAGNGTAGFTGDDGPGKLAEISGPSDVCLDAAHNVYFADQTNGRIRKISAANGVVTTIAGGGTSLADGVPAIGASLSPNYLCMDAGGNIFVTTANEIRRIDAVSGIITTIGGSATLGYSGDGGPASAATFYSPEGICIDATGNLYVADRGNNAIREIYAATGMIATIAGIGSGGYSGDGGAATLARLTSPTNVCVNAAGDVFFADQNSAYPAGYNASIIRKINGYNGVISTIVGSTSGGGATYGIPALLATIGTITGICMDDHGDLFCDEMSCSCRDLKVSSDTLFLVGGNFYMQGYSDGINSPMANMSHPYGLCVDNTGTVYIADYGNNRVRKLIQLTTTPSFAYGRGQTILSCGGYRYPIDSQMAISDIDSGQTETWTVVSAPVSGTLTGFPATNTSTGPNALVYPVGTSYSPSTSYSGQDSFKVQVSDGTLSDIVTVYVSVNSSCPLSVNKTIEETPAICVYPNPATSTLTITSLQQVTTIAITNLLGQVVYNNTASYDPQQIDISGFPSGIYFVKVNGTDVRKFVKE